MAGRSWGAVEEISPRVHRLFMDHDGVFPNNPHYPLLIFAGGCEHLDSAATERAIVAASWSAPWAWGVFDFHHYHSTAWEILACVKGRAVLQLGGPTGPEIGVTLGDVVLVPPGFAHRQLEATQDFTLLGAYPNSGCSGPVDTVRAAPTAAQRANIAAVQAPSEEPISGIQLADLIK